MHGFAAGNDDRIAERSRDVHGPDLRDRPRDRLHRRAGAATSSRTGMLLNVMLSMRAPEHLEREPRPATALAICAFGDALPFVTP